MTRELLIGMSRTSKTSSKDSLERDLRAYGAAGGSYFSPSDKLLSRRFLIGFISLWSCLVQSVLIAGWRGPELLQLPESCSCRRALIPRGWCRDDWILCSKMVIICRRQTIDKLREVKKGGIQLRSWQLVLYSLFHPNLDRFPFASLTLYRKAHLQIIRDINS